MALTDYVTSDALKATLSLSGETFADADITAAIAAASRGIDAMAHRRARGFGKDVAATTARYYTPTNGWYVEIDDLAELASLKTDEDGDGVFETTWTENTDFVLEPLNAADDAWPWTCVTVHPNGARLLPKSYPRSVQVTGAFGWPAVPDVVVEATTILAAKLLRRAREAPFGFVTAGIDEVVAMRVARTDPDVIFLVGPYTRGRVAVA